MADADVNKDGKVDVADIAAIINYMAGEEPDFLCPSARHPHMIDLGLPSGTKWACCNVGATIPTQYGQYYLWTGSDLVKESGLEEWQMPTMEDGQELIDNCYYEWITYEAVNGCVFTGINGNKIFFPATGWLRNDYTEVNIGGEGNYWTITSNGGSAAYDLQFDANRVFMDSGGLTTGLQTIRPVQKR